MAPLTAAGAATTDQHQRERALTSLYFLAFSGVCAIVLGVMFEAIRGVSRKPLWQVARSTALVVELPARPAQQIPILEVEARHSAFTGLTNNNEWSLTA